MFYSRPQITPLGWDLQGMPIPNGSKNFDAMTTDNRPVDFRFSSGWITVKIGPQGAKNTDYDLMETVLERPIAPFGTMDILPEQVCDILGVTIQGTPVLVDSKNIHGRGFDWSGKTTALQRTMHFSADGIVNISYAFNQIFSDAQLVRVDSTVKNKIVERKYTPIQEDKIFDELKEIGTGRHYKVCIDCLSPEKFKSILNSAKPAVNMRDYFTFSCGVGIRKLGVSLPFKNRFPHIEFPSIFTVTFATEYQSDDTVTASYGDKMISTLNNISFKNVEIIELSTNIPRPKLHKWEDYYYSNDLRQWCLEQPNRYLQAVVDSTGSGKEDWRYCAIRPTH